MVFCGGHPSDKKNISNTVIVAAPEEEATGPNPAINDLAERPFAGITPQVQCYGRIGMHSATAVGDMFRNDFLTRSITKNEISNEQRGLFHELQEELRITAGMVAMEGALGRKQSNNKSFALQREIEQKKEELRKQCSCLGWQCRMKSLSTCPYRCSPDEAALLFIRCFIY